MAWPRPTARRQTGRGEREVAELRRLKVASPMVETLAAQLRLKQGDAAGAVKMLREAQPRYPQERAIAYGLVESLLEARLPQDALKVSRRRPAELSVRRENARPAGEDLCHARQAPAAASRPGRVLCLLLGQLALAVEQLELAQKSGDGNFYE
jgi:predicted Zn-dependent protease